MLEKVFEKWRPQSACVSNRISMLNDRIAGMEEDVEAILMERIRDKNNAQRYDRMIEKRESEIAEAKKQIEELQNLEEVLRGRQAKLKKDISLIDDILKEGKLSEAHLRLLMEKILVHEQDGKIDLDIHIKAPFRSHTDCYEDGELVDRYADLNFDWDRLAHIIYGEYCLDEET